MMNEHFLTERLKPVSRYTLRIFSVSAVVVGILTLLLLVSKPTSLSNSSPVNYTEPESEVSLLFMGDIMQHMPQVEAAWNDSLNKYIYDSCFKYVRPIISKYDLAVANLETTLAGKPYSGYPAFSSPDELVTGLLHAGIDLVGTANNHCCDRGAIGVKRTVLMLDSLGLNHMGTYSSQEEHSKHTPVIFSKNGITLALLNYTYGTNGIPVPEGTVVNLIEKERMIQDLNAAKNAKPDKILIFVHWGEEYQREPNTFQKETAQFLFDQGADIIIGSHPHVIQPMEWHKKDSTGRETLVVWSLGNYVSNQRKTYTDGGAMVGLTIRKEGKNTFIKDANYQLTWVYNPIERGRRQYYILPIQRFEQDSVMLGREDFGIMTTFIANSRELLGKNLNLPEIR